MPWQLLNLSFWSFVFSAQPIVWQCWVKEQQRKRAESSA